MSLILSISPDFVKPYKFKVTGINVYSLEESLYHAYCYWKESIDDFVSEEFVAWVNYELNLSYIASRLRDIALIPQLSGKISAFLSIIDYFDEADINKLKAELISWENRFEWEKYKERGDNLIDLNQPEKAYVIYKKALSYDRNPVLLNNTAISLMKMGIYAEAVSLLEKARLLDSQSLDITLNLAEAYIFNSDYDKAAKILESVENLDGNSAIYYLYGELNFAMGNYRPSLEYYEKAIALQKDSHYIYRVTDVYIKLRLYEKAIKNLYNIKDKDKKILVKLAEVYINSGNIPAAIKSVESAIKLDLNCIKLWTMLAMCHRLDYNLDAANDAIIKALAIDKDDERSNFEFARIKKAQGKTRDYQQVLHNVLIMFKNKERERNYGM